MNAIACFTAKANPANDTIINKSNMTSFEILSCAIKFNSVSIDNVPNISINSRSLRFNAIYKALAKIPSKRTSTKSNAISFWKSIAFISAKITIVKLNSIPALLLLLLEYKRKKLAKKTL